MSRTRQLSDLQSDVYKRIDLEGVTAYITPARVTELICQGWARLYGRVCRSGSGFFLKGPETLTLTAAQRYATLPADFYMLRRIDFQVDSSLWRTMDPMNFEEETTFDDGSATGWNGSWPNVGPRFYVQGADGSSDTSTRLVFSTAPAAADAARIYYYPIARRLVNPTDTYDGINGWEKYVIDYAAAEIAEQEESFEVADRIRANMGSEEGRIVGELQLSRNTRPAKPVMRRQRGRTRFF